MCVRQIICETIMLFIFSCILRCLWLISAFKYVYYKVVYFLIRKIYLIAYLILYVQFCIIFLTATPSNCKLWTYKTWIGLCTCILSSNLHSYFQVYAFYRLERCTSLTVFQEIFTDDLFCVNSSRLWKYSSEHHKNSCLHSLYIIVNLKHNMLINCYLPCVMSQN